MSETMTKNRELVLPPGTYAFVLDNTKGKVSVCVGPFKNSLSDTDQLVRWDPENQRYQNANNTPGEQQSFAVAEQGQYIVLTNPAPGLTHPNNGMSNDAVDLEVGRRVIVPGPASFPLWPGQTAQTIEGHHLRHNQYVVVRVYDDEQARENFSNAVMAPQTTGENADAIEQVMSGELGTPDFTMGQLMIVPGTEVSFYMPSTGMEVVPEDDTTVSNARRYQERPTEGKYVRNAVTLETLQYCILIDENGQKRYERGPAVIFPHPTETFKVNENNSRVFDAIELNEQTGLYVKVIEDYDEDGHHYESGEELFITGKEQAIYFPRAEHNIITYGGKRKHHAIAVPAGEGRYLLNRTTGDVELRRGPTMLLPDPRNEVIVRRILDPHDVETMYPGNAEALAVNAIYTKQRDEATTGYLENSEMLRSAKTRSMVGSSRYAGNETAVTDSILASNSPGGQNYLGDAMARGTSYSPPRTIVLDTKYEGAVAISIFPGYAVLITDKVGNRRVEVGPKVVLMEYDETIMALSLSTGRPKTDNRLLKTGYLRVINNVVSDIVSVETKDLVSLNVEVSYRVNFIGDIDDEREKWFGIENYVQVLTDHCRSRLRNAAKRREILDFYTNAIDIVRDTILGVTDEASGDRPRMTFEENNMQVYDVEILEVTIDDVDVEKLLVGAQSAALEGAIELTVAEQRTAREARLLALRRDSIKENEKTAVAEAEAIIAAVAREIEAKLETAKGDVAIRTERLLFEETVRESQRLDAEQRISIQQEEDGVQMMRLTAETTELARRMDALTPGLIQAMVTFGDTVVAERIVTAIAPAAMAAGISTADIMEQVFRDTPFANALTALTHRPLGSGRTAS